VLALSWVTLEWHGLDLRLHAQRGVMSIGGTTVPEMIYGTAPKPFVLRTLVPTLVRLIREAIPDPTARRLWLRILRRCPRLARGLPALEWQEEFLLEYLIGSALMQLCLVGFVLAMRALYECLYPDAGWRRELLALGALLCLPFFFRVGSHFLYDFASLLFVALGLLLMERRRWVLFYPVLTLALLNKETSALLVAVFALRFLREMAARRWLAHVSSQVGLVVAVRSFLLYVYQANPGPPMRWHLRKNLLLIQERGVDGPTVVLFALLLLPPAVRWWSEHRLLRAALGIVPPLTAAYFLFGVYGEIRMFYEAVPAGAIWLFQAALAACGLHSTARISGGRAERAAASG
jgi:hypothetical protein